MPTPQEHFDAARQFQEHYDKTLCRVGTHAPPPALGQSVNDYRRETLRQLKRTFLPQNHPLYQVQFRGLKDDALPVFEQQLLPACVTEAENPAHVPLGEIRELKRLDEFGHLRCIDWVGQESFVKQMPNYRPGRRVKSFSRPFETVANYFRGNERMVSY